jgi:hypothetical protein
MGKKKTRQLKTFRPDKCPCGLPWDECPWNAVPEACPTALEKKITANPEEAERYYQWLSEMIKRVGAPPVIDH